MRALEYLSRAYLELANTDNSQFIFYNTADSDAPVPILSTTTDRKYYLNETNLVDSNGNPISLTVEGQTVYIRKLRTLFMEAKGVSYRYYADWDTYSPYGYPAYWDSWYKERQFVEVPCQPYMRRGGNEASIILFDDYDVDIYAECYYTPSALSGEGVELLLDTEEWLDALIDGAVGYYEDVVNGRSERKEKFRTYWKDKFKRKSVDLTMQKVPNTMQQRRCG